MGARLCVGVCARVCVCECVWRVPGKTMSVRKCFGLSAQSRYPRAASANNFLCSISLKIGARLATAREQACARSHAFSQWS